MKKTAIYILLVASMLLAACTDSTVTTAPADTQISTPNATIPTAVEPGLVSDCTVIAQEPTPGPTAQSLFPPVSANDWVKGPEDAYVTIIEYGDFQ